jgi:hypothetical protein
MTHNIPKHVNTYLCHNHYNSLPGAKIEWTTPLIGFEKCVVCGHKASHQMSTVTLYDEDLARFVVCYFNRADKKYKITKDGVQEISLEEYHNELKNGEWEFDEDEYVHFCGQCHFPLTLVRPGKYQCETPWCPSNQKEETK